MDNIKIKQISQFQQKIKDKVRDAKKNERTIRPELRAFIDMLCKDFRHRKTRQIPLKLEEEFKDNEHLKIQMALALGYQLPPPRPLQEEQREYEYFLFFFFMSKDNSDRKSIYISTKNKHFYSIVQALTELKDMNIFVSIATFFPRYNHKANRAEIRRTSKQSAYTNVVIADLDTYKTERFKSTPPKEVFEIIKQENQTLFNTLPIAGVMSGNGLQLYCFIKTITLPLKEEKSLWKALSKEFNDLFRAYGSDEHCTGDTARMLRLPFTNNCKKSSIPVELLTDIPKLASSVNEFLTALSLKRSSLDIKLSSDDKKARNQKKKEQLQLRRKKNLEKAEQNFQESWKEHYKKQEEWKKIATPEELEEHNFKSKIGKVGREKLYLYRSSDLLAYLRNRDYDIKGYRHHFLFIFIICHRDRYHQIDLTLEEMQYINSLLQEPLTANEVEQIVDSVYAVGYQHLTNEYIKMQLDMSKEETEQSQLSYSKEQHLRKERLRWQTVRKHQRREKQLIAKEERKKKKAEKEQKIAELILSNWDMSIQQLMKTYETGVKSNILYRIKANLKKEQN